MISWYAVGGTYRCVEDTEHGSFAGKPLVEELRAAECISIDTETMGLAPLLDPLVGVCLSTKVGTGVYVPVRSKWPQEHLDEATVLGALRPVLEDPRVPKCGHNLKFDMLVLRPEGGGAAGRELLRGRARGVVRERRSWRSGT